MELQEFITESLKQIVSGVKGAQEHAESEGALINPQISVAAISGSSYLKDHGGRLGQIIEFDVAVTTIERDQAEGRIGILIASLGAGVKGREEWESSNVSRISFSVPVFLPAQKTR